MMRHAAAARGADAPRTRWDRRSSDSATSLSHNGAPGCGSGPSMARFSGVLEVVLNASAPTLCPELIRYGLSHVLKKQRDDGSFRYPHNDGVVIISEAHTDATPRIESRQVFVKFQLSAKFAQPLQGVPATIPRPQRCTSSSSSWAWTGIRTQLRKRAYFRGSYPSGRSCCGPVPTAASGRNMNFNRIP